MRSQSRLGGLFHTYPTQLAIGLLLLIVATTLSAGVPAYWLTHVQLNQQVAAHLRDAQQSTLSLLQLEQHRLANIALLFAERPTLANLLAVERDAAQNQALVQYIADFQAQIDLDLLLLCTTNNEVIAGSLPIANCPANAGFLWVDDRPVLAARHPLSATTENRESGVVVAGMWLDAPFLVQLAAGTGVQQTLLDMDGNRLVSSLSATEGLQSATTRLTNPLRMHTPLETVVVEGHRHVQLIAPLVNPDDEVVFYSEILLSADELFATRNRVLAILLTSTGIVALLGMALGVWSIRRLTSPLASLTALAERISQGEFEIPIPHVKGPVEVETLTAALQRSQASIVQALGDRAAARDRLDNLVQSLVEGVVIIDREGKIIFWNQGAALITGWPPEQAHGKSLDRVLPPVESHQPTLLRELPPAGQRRRFTVLTSGGKSTALEVTRVRSALPMMSFHDNFHDNGFHDNEERALVLRDVTEEEATHHLRAYFLANISHEFRTPLSVLNASIELLMDESQDASGAEMRSLLKPIHLSLLELQTLIDNLLEGSTIEAGQFRLRQRAMTLNEAITGALTLVHPMLERRGQTISVTEPATLGEIWADRVRLTQVLVNLLANASKYTPLGEAIDVSVAVTSNRRNPLSNPSNAGSQKEAETVYRVMIADRGPGIPAAERVNLFRRFVRLDAAQAGDAGAQKADVHGTGIGLYVVKTAIEAHGGRVGIEDRPGGGSIFWFELPRGPL